MATGRLLLAFLTTLALAPFGAADEPPAAQRDQQRRVQAEVEQTARRVTTTLRVLAYQKLDPSAEQKVLDEVAAGLRSLSREQMTAVLNHLEAAIKAPDEAAATVEQRQAYQKHREVVASLRGMLVKLDTLKSLDQAAERLTRYAREQHDLHLQSLAADGRSGNRRRGVDDREEHSDAQADLRAELTNLVKQLAGLRPSLNPEQKDRLDRADAFGRGGQLVAQMEIARQSVLNGSHRAAAEGQLKTSQELQGLAAAIRGQGDKAAALREARDRVEKLLQAEQELKKDTETRPDFANRRERFDRGRTDPTREHANQLADRQARLEFDTRDVRKTVDELAREVAAKLTPAESEMRRAQDELRDGDLKGAVSPEGNAADRLREARDELDKLIEAAEKAKSDPLEAAKRAAEQIEQIIKEQTAAREMTEANAKKPDNLKPASDAQKDVAKKTDDVRNLPLPDSKELKDALNKAADATRTAANELARRNADAAQPKQSEALQALQDAKKALEEKAATIEKRREDIAKLDEAAKKLEELARQEKKVADDAMAQANPQGEQKPDTGELAKKQGELTPPTKEVGEMVKDTAPEAAHKINEATRNQDAARDQLAQNEARPGSEQANEAAKKLNEARDALARKADEMKAQEIADQAAMQPNRVNPADAAQQIAKAIEEANKASQEANRAAQQLGQQPNQQPMDDAAQNLARLQRQVAERAKRLEQPNAQQAAAEAAESLEKGDLQTALDRQQQALEQLNKAGQPAQGRPMPQGQPNPGQAQNAGDLAQSQQQIREATEALAKSSEATAAAQAALAQAQAQAPTTVQPQLNQAGQQLGQAQQQLGQGQPSQAGQAQSQAARQLGQALSALNAAAQAMGQQGAQPGQNQQAQANAQGQQPGQEGQQPGQQPGQGQQASNQPGKQPGQQGKQPGDGQEKNDGIAEGNRQGPGQMKNATAQGKEATGDGAFINLQKRERDKVQQNAEAAFPAEFRELIKQYNINIKTNGQPQKAAPPAKK
jgi:hypothetical protein